MKRFEFYTAFWFFWVIWVQTIGRIQGFGLSTPSILLFDVSFIVLWKFILTRHVKDANSFGLKEQVGKLSFFQRNAIKLLMAVLAGTVLFQIPFDWDGMDYHLPSIVESWQRGFWARSEIPYVQARNYPKIASLPALWFLEHFGSVTGLRLLLVIPFMHLLFGLKASFELVARNRWVLLFWLTMPLIARESVTYYADLAGLTTFLVFLVFIRRQQWIFAGMILAIHSSLKFTNLVTAAAALLCVNAYSFYLTKKLMTVARAKVNLILVLPVIAFALIQPLENIRYEGRPFGNLKCTILGQDYCDGMKEPIEMITAPTLPQFPAEDPLVTKILNGWLPSHFILPSDGGSGGFGLAWLFTLMIGALAIARRSRKIFTSNPLHSWVGFALGTALFADSLIAGIWYQRFHLLLGWVLCMSAALICMRLKAVGSKKSLLLIGLILFVQTLMLIPQRNWFLGVQSSDEKIKIVQNLKNILKKGYPAHATNPADQQSIHLLDQNAVEHSICGEEIRPILPVYGSHLRNQVNWYAPKNSVLSIDALRGKWNYRQCP